MILAVAVGNKASAHFHVKSLVVFCSHLTATVEGVFIQEEGKRDSEHTLLVPAFCITEINY